MADLARVMCAAFHGIPAESVTDDEWPATDRNVQRWEAAAAAALQHLAREHEAAAPTDAALRVGDVMAGRMFAGRTGHAGTPGVSQRHLTHAQLAAALALAVHFGAKHGAGKPIC